MLLSLMSQWIPVISCWEGLADMAVKQLILMGKETPTTSIRDCNITFFYPMKEKVPPKLAKPQVHSLFATKISLKRVNK